jgi:hypothetical protein
VVVASALVDALGPDGRRMAAVLAGPYYLAHRYVKARQNH